MYNKLSFNKSLFNRIENENDTGFVAAVSSVFDVVVAPISVTVILSSATIMAETGMVVKAPGLLIPLGEMYVNAECSIFGQLSAKIPLNATAIDAEFDFSTATIRTAESEELELSGVNLAPGQTLIIDTDTIDIEVDGEVRVDCWVTGGVFFQLKKGENQLTFTDNANSRNLVVTILWADRYL